MQPQELGNVPWHALPMDMWQLIAAHVFARVGCREARALFGMCSVLRRATYYSKRWWRWAVVDRVALPPPPLLLWVGKPTCWSHCTDDIHSKTHRVNDETTPFFSDYLETQSPTMMLLYAFDGLVPRAAMDALVPLYPGAADVEEVEHGAIYKLTDEVAKFAVACTLHYKGAARTQAVTLSFLVHLLRMCVDTQPHRRTPYFRDMCLIIQGTLDMSKFAYMDYLNAAFDRLPTNFLNSRLLHQSLFAEQCLQRGLYARITDYSGHDQFLHALCRKVGFRAEEPGLTELVVRYLTDTQQGFAVMHSVHDVFTLQTALCRVYYARASAPGHCHLAQTNLCAILRAFVQCDPVGTYTALLNYYTGSDSSAPPRWPHASPEALKQLRALRDQAAQHLLSAMQKRSVHDGAVPDAKRQRTRDAVDPPSSSPPLDE